MNLFINLDHRQSAIIDHEPHKVENGWVSSAGAGQVHQAANWHWISGTDDHWGVPGRVWKIWHMMREDQLSYHLLSIFIKQALTGNIESLCLLCCLLSSFIHRISGRTADGESIVFLWQIDGRLDLCREGSICVFLHHDVRVLLEGPGEFRRRVWTGSGCWAAYGDRLLLQITWDLNHGLWRRICGFKANTHRTLNNRAELNTKHV